MFGNGSRKITTYSDMLIYFRSFVILKMWLKESNLFKVHARLGFHSISAFLNSSGHSEFTDIDLVIFADKYQ